MLETKYSHTEDFCHKLDVIKEYYLHKREVFLSGNKSFLTLWADILEFGIAV